MLKPASPSAPYFCLQEVTSRLRTPSKDIISVAVYMTLATTERERPPDMRRYLFLQKSNFDILCQPLAPDHSTSAPFFFSFFFVIFSLTLLQPYYHPPSSSYSSTTTTTTNTTTITNIYVYHLHHSNTSIVRDVSRKLSSLRADPCPLHGVGSMRNEVVVTGDNKTDEGILL